MGLGNRDAGRMGIVGRRVLFLSRVRTRRFFAGLGAAALFGGGFAAVVASVPAGADQPHGSSHGWSQGGDGPSEDGFAQTLYVSHTGTAGATDTGCTSAAYSSVQSALTAATPGETVYLCGTTPFVGSVVIDKAVTLTGDPGASIVAGDTSTTTGLAPTTFFTKQGLATPHSVVTILSTPAATGSGTKGAPPPWSDAPPWAEDHWAQNVRIVGLGIAGPFDASGCGYTDFGVLALSGSVQLVRDAVSTIRASSTSLWGCQTGVGVQVGRRYWPAAAGTYKIVEFAAHATVWDTTVTTYQKNGVTADGPGSSIAVFGSTVSGNGPTAHTAQNGIQISRGATGTVRATTVAGNESTVVAPTAVGTGILVYGGCGTPLSSGVGVFGDTLVNNDVGIDFANYNKTCTGPATTATRNRAIADTITKSDGDTNKSDYNGFTSYQAGIADAGTGDLFVHLTITGTVTSSTGTDLAYGPKTTAGGPFLAPMTLTTARAAHAADVVFDGTSLYGDGGSHGDTSHGHDATTQGHDATTLGHDATTLRHDATTRVHATHNGVFLRHGAAVHH